MADEGVARQLDRVIAILQLAFRDQIEKARREVLEDPVNAAILDLTATDWVVAGDLKDMVGKATKQGSRTVERRLARLVAIGSVEQGASGPKSRYRSTGVL